MSKREVMIYTCDGCHASATVNKEETVRGFTQIRFPDTNVWLCTVCYGAVDWVVRFQRITVPPRVFKHDGRYGLRKEQS